MNTQPITILIYIAAAIAIFLLLRELVTWYWKINRMVDSLDRIDKNIQYIAYILREQNPDVAKKVETKEDDEFDVYE